MTLAGQSVTLRTYTDGVTRDSLNQPQQSHTDTVWSGVLFRPFRPSETVTLTDVATQVWRCTGTPIPQALSLTQAGELIYEGNTYQVTGVEPFYDLGGAVDHVRVTCQRQKL